MSNGVTGGVFATLADLQASKPRVKTRVELVAGERYSIDAENFGEGIAVNGLFANPTEGLTTSLINSTAPVYVDEIRTTAGYRTKGDGGGAQWKFTGVTGQTPSQSPADLGEGALTDASGNKWELVVSDVFLLESIGFNGLGDQTNFALAAVNSAKSGSKITLLKRYEFDLSGFIVEGKTLHFDFKNSLVNKVSTNSLIYFKGSYKNTQSVSSLTTSNGKTVVTVQDPSAYSEGDVIKIVSDDEQPDLWVSGRNMGQFAVVYSINSNDITLNSLVYDSDLYLTNVLIAKLTGYSGIVENLNVNVEDSIVDHLPLFLSKDLQAPIFSNIVVNNSKDTVFSFVSCFGYFVNKSCAKNALSSPGTSNFGYIVNDSSSHGGFVNELNVYGCRHGFTTNSHESTGSGDLSCGYTTKATISTCNAYNAEAGGWDTHPGAIDVVFNKCSTFDSESYGQSRSRGTKFINPIGRNNITGIKFSTGKSGSTINPIKDNVITDPDLEYTSTMLEVYKSASTNIALTDITDIRVSGGQALSKNGSYRGLLLESRNVPVNISFKNLDLIMKEEINTDALMLLSATDYNDISVKNITVTSEINSTSTDAIALVKPTSTITSLAHKVIAQGVTYKGSDFKDRANILVQNADALLSNARVESLNNGTFNPVVGGALLTWGGEL